MKKLTKILLIIFGVGVLIGAVAAILALNYYKKGIAPISGESKEVIVTVESGQTATSVLYTLEEVGLLKDVFCGKVYLKLNTVGNLQANTYILNENMSLETIFQIMENPSDEYIMQMKVTVIDGSTIPEVAKAIASGMEIQETDVTNLLSDETFLQALIEDYWFITEDILQEGIKYPLEGYLYPETYLFNKNVTLEEVIRTFLDMMDKQLTSVKDKLETLDWSVHEFLAFASVVERESLFDEDKAKIAGVLMNRLEANMLLQVDCTVNYAWERTGVDVTYTHLEIDSPYNTYKYAGLPIGPISTVSANTMDACIHYEENDYFYFFAKEDGTVIYSKTLSEHTDTVQKNKWY